MSCHTSSAANDFVTLDNQLGLNFYDPAIVDEGCAPPPAPESDRAIRLSWSVSRYNYNDTDGIRVRITADQPVMMPDKIFAYMLLPMKPGAGSKVGAFDHVCSPIDLEEYPEDTPIPGSRPEWFRLNYVDVLLRSRTEVYEFIKDVISDVKRLKHTLNLMDNLMPGGEMWIGPEPSPESSSSAGV
jgi:hypothetical protein